MYIYIYIGRSSPAISENSPFTGLPRPKPVYSFISGHDGRLVDGFKSPAVG